MGWSPANRDPQGHPRLPPVRTQQDDPRTGSSRSLTDPDRAGTLTTDFQPQGWEKSLWLSAPSLRR